ncbi:Bifunctional protein MdtA [Pirellulimonas nuda]|uniref:Bifunctional protein MdtA n=1 Tax=Pirellulimonas nuda TaxID=2528009 RepID=A0A518DJL1_9BACT|nr:NAD(P)-dependent methylenetetrahydromethanopterin dehydrogenase [Pirellulimonas nuda]QDU91663.1 Bifunctional protein MdtA [Pirellulimonas nuda]
MKRILLCLDTDPQPSVFDAVVAVDAGADLLLRHGAVGPDAVEALVHGAIFTRAPADLKYTAIAIGGSDVAAGERVLRAVTAAFFGPMRVSVLLDSNGSNTTAAAAVLAAGRHAQLGPQATAVVVGAGPVGQRCVELLTDAGCPVRLVMRNQQRADQAAAAMGRQGVTPLASIADALDGAQVLIAAGPPGVELVTPDARLASDALRVAIDLNAVPPLGIAGVEMADKAVDRGGCACYGAIGVGGLKMKIHRAAIARLFESNDQVLGAAEVFALARELFS